MARRSQKKREEQIRRVLSLVRLWLIVVVLAAVALLTVCEFVGEGGGISGRLFGPRGIESRAEMLESAVEAALVRLHVSGASAEETTVSERGVEWTHRTLTGRLPAGVDAYEANLEVTKAVRAAGGEIVRVTERGPSRQGRRTIELRIGARGRETHAVVLHESDKPSPPPIARGEGEGVRPRVALVIDDFGHNELSTATGFLELDVPVTISVLPGRPHSRDIADAAHRAGKEIMVHIPMEPKGYPKVNPGDGALLVGQSGAEIRSIVTAAVEGVPYAVGANNHMGSEFTSHTNGMRVVMSELSKHGLFFIDSMTTPLTKGVSEAKRAGIPTARNNAFIDSKYDERGNLDVASQMKRLEDIAREQGGAIGIGHPKEETLRALREMIPEMKARGVKFVFASELVR